ncbi:MAG: hypothetical protein SVC26_02220, partial [Pseudomonadota bacterium]|nr:hypothetical protein [Pseudomonadota bacterium]
MKIIHLTSTPLAGAPIRLSNALNKYTELKSRVINFNPYAYGARTFPEDLCFHQNPALCLDLISEADVIHFHHPYMDFFTESGGYNLDKIKSTSAKCIYHYHSSPVNLKKVADTVKPSLVVAHCAERYFPHARLMPNVVDTDFLEQNVSLDCNTVK